MPVEEKTNWAPIIIGAGALGMMGLGIYFWTRKKEEPGVPSSLVITSYQNLRTGKLVSSPNILDDVLIGDTIRISFEYGYSGLAITGQYHVAVWKKTLLDSHDEFASIDTSFSLPDTPDKVTISASVDLVCESWDMTPDTYGLYVKIMSIPGPDVHYYLAGVIKVIGGVPPEIDFIFTRPTVTPSGTLLPGTSITIVCSIQSKCAASQIVTVQCNILEGSGILWTPGTLIASYNSTPFTILPGQTAQLSYNHITVKGTIDHRDIVVKVLKAGVIIKKSQNFNDVYYVRGVPLTSPNVITLTAAELAHDGAILRGQLYGIGDATSVNVYFQYGKTTAYGKTTPKVGKYPADDYKIFEAEVYGLLEPETTYHFRAVAEPIAPPGLETDYGEDKSFKTLPTIPPGEVTFGVTWVGIFATPNSKFRVTIPLLDWDSGKRLRYENAKYVGDLLDSIVIITLRAYDPSDYNIQIDNFYVKLYDGDSFQWDYVARTLTHHDGTVYYVT